MSSSNKRPTPLGLRRSFGFGDRLGLASPGHIAAARRFPDIQPVLASQSIDEMAATGRAPDEVVLSVADAVRRSGYDGAWAAEAGGLRTAEDIKLAAASGFRSFQLDVSADVDSRADQLDEAGLRMVAEGLEHDGFFDGFDWRGYYLGRFFSIGHRLPPIQFDEEDLLRAVVKFERAVARAERLGALVENACGKEPFEIGVVIDSVESALSPAEHLFIALEIQRRGVPQWISLSARWHIGLEPAVDFKGDIKTFEDRMKAHAGIAKFAGPYKLGIVSGADKFSVYPMLGRVCGALLHIQTSGTSYLEALRIASRTAPGLFREVVAHCKMQFDGNRAAGRVSTTLQQVAALPEFHGRSEEPRYFDQPVGRQLLHSTFFSTMSGKDSQGTFFKNRIIEAVSVHSSDYHSLIELQFIRHLSLLSAG